MGRAQHLASPKAGASSDPMSEPGSAEELLEVVIDCAKRLADATRPGDGAYKLRKLVEVSRWAEAQQPHQPGDRVKLCHRIDFDRAHGWARFRDDLRVGAVGTVQHLGFANDRWYAEVEVAGNAFRMPMSWLGVP